ncbi:MAG: hypothetical protein H7X89_09150 [Rhizobiales bacterium]|nr:hypothetical protein [Hyphomicrobiales bacterium]
MYRQLLAVIVLCVSLCAPAEGASDDELYIGVFSTGQWYACSDRQVAENIAETFVTRGGEAALSLFHQNALLCDLSPTPTKLYVQTVVWHREMNGDTGNMKVVLMWEWQDGKPQRSYYVLTLRPVNGSGISEGGMIRVAM